MSVKNDLSLSVQKWFLYATFSWKRYTEFLSLGLSHKKKQLPQAFNREHTIDKCHHDFKSHHKQWLSNCIKSSKELRKNDDRMSFAHHVITQSEMSLCWWWIIWNHDDNYCSCIPYLNHGATALFLWLQTCYECGWFLCASHCHLQLILWKVSGLKSRYLTKLYLEDLSHLLVSNTEFQLHHQTT